MNDLVVPICFRGIRLSWSILECFKTCLRIEYEMCSEDSWQLRTPEVIRAQCNVAEYVRIYTQHIFINEESLDWSWVPDMLSSLGNLKHLTCVIRSSSISRADISSSWGYWGGFSDGVEPSIQYAVLACPAFRARCPKLRISVEDLYEGCAIPFWPLLVDITSCTDGNLERLENLSSTPTFSAIQIKDMLLASPQMEVCDLGFDSSDDVTVDWNIKDGEKLPPFKDLHLSLIDWAFSPVEAVEFWDWSRITYLKLSKVPIIPFLKTVGPSYLSGLRTFETDCHGSEKNVEEASRLLCDLVENIVTLDGRTISCSIKTHLNRCFPEIIKHGSNIRWLTLRQVHSPQGDPGLHAVIPNEKLIALSSACPNLTRLEIDVMLDLEDPMKTGHVLTTTLASFRKVRELWLYTRIPDQMPIYTYLRCSSGVVEAKVRSWAEELCSSMRAEQS